jgi:hypothetical protein
VELLARQPAHYVHLHDYSGVNSLITQLALAGAKDQVNVLVNRLPASGQFRLFTRHIDLRDVELFRFGREVDGRPASPWGWDDLD